MFQSLIRLWIGIKKIFCIAKFFDITDGLKDELGDNIYSSLCNIENVSDDVVEL